MNTVESGEKSFEETSESISDVIQGLIEQLQIINEQDREKVQEMVLQMNQFLQQPALLENMSLLNETCFRCYVCVLERIGADVAECSRAIETVPADGK